MVSKCSWMDPSSLPRHCCFAVVVSYMVYITCSLQNGRNFGSGRHPIECSDTEDRHRSEKSGSWISEAGRHRGSEWGPVGPGIRRIIPGPAKLYASQFQTPNLRIHLNIKSQAACREQLPDVFPSFGQYSCRSPRSRIVDGNLIR